MSVGNPARTTVMAEDAPSWLTIAEVAALLKIHPNTVRRLILTGRLPALRVGGRGSAIRINIQHLDAFIRDALTADPATDTDTDTASDETQTTDTDTAR
jgi:excisionase family DNA binding protein